MSEQASSYIELILNLLTIVVGGFSIIALIVGVRGIQKARKDSYDAAHKEFLNLQERVRKELRKD